MDPKKARVVVVDDMSAIRDLVSACLRDMGVRQIAEAVDGNKALPYVGKADLIICDWDMPVMTGLDLLKEVRSRPSTKHLPFIMLTAISDKTQVATAIKEGVTDYITKPFQPKQLYDRVSKNIANIQKSKPEDLGFEDLTEM